MSQQIWVVRTRTNICIAPWIYVNKIIDKLRIWTHKDEIYKMKCGPDKLKSVEPAFSAVNRLVWLSRF